MRTPTSTRPVSRALDSERAYFAEVSTVPRFDRDRETERARAIVRSRRAYWAVLLAPTRLDGVLRTLVEQAKDRTVVELARELCTELERGAPAEAIERGVVALAEAIDRVGDEHGASDAIVALAARVDEGWHARAVRARAAFLHARNRFVSANLRLVLAYAHRYGTQLLPLVDRIQEGNIGLMKAVDRFDPERGLRFSTYACWWIRHTILRALSTNGRTVRVPSQIQGLHGRLERARRRLCNELGRQPEREELAAAIGCTLEQLDRVSLTMQLHDARGPAGAGEEGWDVFDTLGDDASLAAFEQLAEGDDRERLREALRDLPEREQDILHERFGFPGASVGTLRELGGRYGLSRERVRQIQAGALEQLRRKLEPPRVLPPLQLQLESFT